VERRRRSQRGVQIARDADLPRPGATARRRTPVARIGFATGSRSESLRYDSRVLAKREHITLSIGGREVASSNPSKILFTDAGITKLELFPLRLSRDCAHAPTPRACPATWRPTSSAT
jgi:hypothetical protein